MPISFGFALESRGCWVAATSPGDAEGPPEVWWADFPADIAQPGFFDWCDSFLPRLTAAVRDPQIDDSMAAGSLRAAMVRGGLEQLYPRERRRHDWDAPDAVGVSHPYAMAPMERRVLPVLLCGNPIPPAGAPEPRRAAQWVARDGARLSAIESPLAGCLDLVARNALALPAHIFLLTGQAPHSELTSVRVARDVEQLRLTVEFSWQVAGDPAGRVLEGWLESVVRSPDAGTSPTPRVIAYGDHLRDEAEKIARRLAPPESEVTCEAEANLAAGAARWAAMCTEKRLHGCQPEISKLHVDHANPWEVGLVCANSGGAMFWHRLFARGQRLPTETVPLAAKGASPEEVLILAERRAEGAGASWLEQALWQENDLRWFTSAAPGAIEGGVVADLVVRLVHPSGRLEYGWSDPFVQARWLPRGAMVESLSWA